MKKMLVLSILVGSIAAQVAQAGEARCTGSQDGMKVSLKLKFNAQDFSNATFSLIVQKSGEPKEVSSGKAQLGGGDGMLMATLAGDDAQAAVGELRWWDVPSMTPGLSLNEPAVSIELKCSGLPR